jgi:hypothetical protein
MSEHCRSCRYSQKGVEGCPGIEVSGPVALPETRAARIASLWGQLATLGVPGPLAHKQGRGPGEPVACQHPAHGCFILTNQDMSIVDEKGCNDEGCPHFGTAHSHKMSP